MKTKPRRFFRNNGLTFALVALFVITYFGGQLMTGWRVYNEDQRENGEPEVALLSYMITPEFAEATGENWESEFLQMFVYVVLTTFLFQKGSAESNDPDRPQARRAVTAHSPGPVRRGGWSRRIYSHSLSLALVALFLISFWLHAWGSTAMENEKRLRLGELPYTFAAHLHSARFWFESFQNWQSEFLAILSMVVLTIFLRERNSPESKDLEAPHDETG